MNTRLIALHLLSRVLEKKQMLEQAFDQEDSFKSLAAKDKGFTHMMVATTLRHLGQIDEIIAHFLDNGRGHADPMQAQHILRLGVTQLLFMSTSPHAAINETVELCRHARLPKLKGLVNAVLRRVSEQGEDLLKQIPSQSNIPNWLYDRWIKDYKTKHDPNLALNIAIGSLNEAATDITVKDPDKTPYYTQVLNGETLANGSIRLPKDHDAVHTLEGFKEGAWWVQDIAAALPVHLLGDVSGARVLDLCAAPGGKTMQLAAMGAKVTALDRSEKRLNRLYQNLERTELDGRVETVTANALTWAPDQPFTHILIDAPCSATGTIRRHPDLLHVKHKKDLEKLQALQANILARLPDFLVVGGIAIYATCSLQKSEGEAQIDAFLKDHKNFKRMPITSNELFGLNDLITPQGDMRCLPHYSPMKNHSSGGMDGFFAARITRKT